MSLYADF